MPIPSFHEVRFPLSVALGASGGPVRRTAIVPLASGRESRNARWSRSRRRFDAGTGVRSLADLHAVLHFFEARAGRLFGFRFRDPLEHASCPPGAEPGPADQPLGTGDGSRTGFPLALRYGAGDWATRAIAKPVAGSVRVAVDGRELAMGSEAGCDPATGLVTLAAAPAPGAAVTAGFLFDVPVRFDSDELNVSLSAFRAGEIPSIPLLEILP